MNFDWNEVIRRITNASKIQVIFQYPYRILVMSLLSTGNRDLDLIAIFESNDTSTIIAIIPAGGLNSIHKCWPYGLFDHIPKWMFASCWQHLAIFVKWHIPPCSLSHATTKKFTCAVNLLFLALAGKMFHF